MLSIFDKAEVLQEMDRLAEQMTNARNMMRDMQLEYWHMQSLVYATGECQHGTTHFCSDCGNNQEAPGGR
jgi:hypothetical protein